METNNNQVEMLNDLILINNDRIEGYTKAVDQLKNENEDLKPLFHTMIQQSRNYNQELVREITASGGEPADGTTVAGDLYRTWMDIKATFTGPDRKSILNSCEAGEDAAKRAYKSVVESGTLNASAMDTVRKQQQEQMAAHDKIKMMRDQEQK